jgi:hypothetical protein
MLQLELEIVCYLISDLRALNETLEERPFLILRNWYRLYCSRRVLSGSWSMIVLVIYQSWRTPLFGWGLRIADLKLRG